LLLNESRAAGLLEAVIGYVEETMLAGRQVPTEKHLDHLADAISGIEYYLENLVDQKVASGGILDVTEASVDALGSGAEVIPFQRDQQDASGTQAPVFGLPAEGEDDFDLSQIEITDLADLGEHDKLDLESFPDQGESRSGEEGEDSGEAVTSAAGEGGEEAETVDLTDLAVEKSGEPPAQPTVEEDGTPTVGEAAFESPYPVLDGDDIDDEILEIFQEEAEEEVANIRELLPRWLENEEDKDALTEARRSFHTIKGSGRLVGAKLIGEFAWAFENMLNRVIDQNMLNRVIDQTVARSPEMCALLEKTLEALPQLVEQLRGGAAPSLDVIAMMEKADALARGETPEIGDLTLGAVAPVQEATRCRGAGGGGRHRPRAL